MTLTERLLANCEEHGAFLWTFKGRWFIKLGEIMAVGGSLEEAVENWCQQVEAHPKLGPKVKETAESLDCLGSFLVCLWIGKLLSPLPF